MQETVAGRAVVAKLRTPVRPACSTSHCRNRSNRACRRSSTSRRSARDGCTRSSRIAIASWPMSPAASPRSAPAIAQFNRREKAGASKQEAAHAIKKMPLGT